MLAALGLATEGPGAVTRLTAVDWAAMGYLAVMVTAVAFLLWYSTVAALGAGLVGLLTGIAPISAAAVGIVIGGNVPSVPVWCGVLVVLGGLSMGLSGPHREPVTDAGENISREAVVELPARSS
jgi:drug/metabolite transporter (DMT)-like permease